MPIGDPRKRKRKIATQTRRGPRRPSEGRNLKGLTRRRHELEPRIQLECAKRKGSLGAAGPRELPATDRFCELPISQRTKRGLADAQFQRLTPIQVLSIPSALGGRDVLGEAETGSGKTLAFVVPVLEGLYRARWDALAGLGAIVISPTRELAAQIFGVFRQVGKYHDFSAACLIGGSNVKFEQQRINAINIIIATPGRLLHHLDESPGFEAANLQVLVVDEADQLVDMGFAETTASILQHLPGAAQRQTLLFSATLNSAVRRLALISLRPDAESISALTAGDCPVPSRLKQTVIEAELPDQMNFLFSFLRAHSQRRCIVFVNACKQVRFIYEVFHRLKPGPAMFELHGRQSQQKRLVVLHSFTTKPHAAALICTDIAARGIDFPSVDWVVHLNCPHDVESYIHRGGRTARYNSAGKSVLFLLPSEKKFLDRLQERNIKLDTLHINPKKMLGIQPKLASIIAASPTLRHLAERAYVSYLRAVGLASDKETFSLPDMLPTVDSQKAFAESLGLPAVPESFQFSNVILIKKQKETKLEKLKRKIRERKNDRPPSSEDTPASTHPSARERRQTRLRRLREYAATATSGDPVVDGEADASVLEVVDSVERGAVTLAGDVGGQRQDVHRKLRKQTIRIRADGSAKVKGLAALDPESTGGHIFFDDKAQPEGYFDHVVAELNNHELDGENIMSRETYVRGVQERIAQNRQSDKENERDRIRRRHLRKRGAREPTEPSFPPTLNGTAELTDAAPSMPKKKRRMQNGADDSRGGDVVALDDLESAVLLQASLELRG